MNKKVVVLLSGGLDSTTVLYLARRDGYAVHALTLHYGQLHEKELMGAHRIAESLEIPHEVVRFELPWKGSALLDPGTPVPKGRDEIQMAAQIPVTYVPARNTIFLSLATSMAETIGASVIFIGANVLDYSGYPDCRPEYFEAFREVIRRGTRAGAEGKTMGIEAPLIRLSKKEIITLALDLGVPFEKTWSCYQGEKKPCLECDACKLRAKGFHEAGIEDPLVDKYECLNPNNETNPNVQKSNV